MSLTGEREHSAAEIVTALRAPHRLLSTTIIGRQNRPAGKLPHRVCLVRRSLTHHGETHDRASHGRDRRLRVSTMHGDRGSGDDALGEIRWASSITRWDYEDRRTIRPLDGSVRVSPVHRQRERFGATTTRAGAAATARSPRMSLSRGRPHRGDRPPPPGSRRPVSSIPPVTASKTWTTERDRRAGLGRHPSTEGRCGSFGNGDCWSWRFRDVRDGHLIQLRQNAKRPEIPRIQGAVFPCHLSDRVPPVLEFDGKGGVVRA